MNLHVFAAAALAVLALVSAAFLPAAYFKRNDLADVIWGPGFLVAALGAWWVDGRGAGDFRLVAALSLVTVWALRLAMHIGIRNFSHAREDARYAEWRAAWGKTWWWRSYAQVFLLQGLLLLVIDLPILWILAAADKPVDIFCYFGAVIWLIGFAIETIS